jgi:hypothetical protein
VLIGDPDTVYDGGYFDYTFGTDDLPFLPKDKCGGGTITPRVPVIRTPAMGAGSSTQGNSGSTTGEVSCLYGDALPNGARYPGGAAMGPGGNPDLIWAPSVVQFNGQWLMFFTFEKNAYQKCIGRATSSSLAGPYQAQSEWACPPNGNWAIDASAIIDGGNLFVAYRDDYSNGQSKLRIVPTDGVGNEPLGARAERHQLGWR